MGRFYRKEEQLFLIDSLTYRAVKKTTGIHAQVQAGRDTLDPQLTPGDGRSLKYRWKNKRTKELMAMKRRRITVRFDRV